MSSNLKLLSPIHEQFSSKPIHHSVIFQIPSLMLIRTYMTKPP